MPTPSRPSTSTAYHLERMHQAVDAVLQSAGFPPDAFRTRQTTPIHANARPTLPNPANARQTPPSPFLQNEATFLNGASASSPRAPLLPTHTCQSAPNPANAHHQTRPCKTNPTTRPPRPLTPNQLRAAHLLVAGHSNSAIAASLAINRHTLAAWKTKPLFQLELRRLLQSPFDTPRPVS